MKSAAIAMCLVLVLLACAAWVQDYESLINDVYYPPRDPDAIVDRFVVRAIDDTAGVLKGRDYLVIARFRVTKPVPEEILSEGLVARAMRKARESGGDAIIYEWGPHNASLNVLLVKYR
jgi:hypothetical protein